jgi:hypothetical protein
MYHNWRLLPKENDGGFMGSWFKKPTGLNNFQERGTCLGSDKGLTSCL